MSSGGHRIIIGVPEGLPEPPGEVLGLSGPEGRERAAAQEVARPSHEESELD